MPTGTPKNGINSSWYVKGHAPTKGAFKKGHGLRNTGRTRFKKGNIPPFKGKHLPDDVKLKLSKALMGKKAPKTAFKKGECSGFKNMRWKGGVGRFPNCIVCKRKLSFLRGIYCRKHRFELMRGENHSRWIGDKQRLLNLAKASKERKGTLYSRWRNTIVRRDDNKCKINNEDCAGLLEVHHILNYRDFPNLRYDINNGIALCHAHHPRKRAEEKRMIPIFRELLSVSKDQF